MGSASKFIAKIDVANRLGQIARQRLREAEANRASALEQFFPWLGAGISYHRRDGLAQAVPAGTISETHFESYAPGGTVTAQVVLGDAIYNSLATRQLVRASDQALEAQRQDSTLSVFTRDAAGTLRHFYMTHPWLDDDI